jgi:hypothetical protein
MSDEPKRRSFIDARSAMDLTPIPDLDGPPLTVAEADLKVAQSTCEQLQRTLATAQALIDEQTRIIEKLRSDRRVLASRVKSLEDRLVTLTGDVL